MADNFSGSDREVICHQTENQTNLKTTKIRTVEGSTLQENKPECPRFFVTAPDSRRAKKFSESDPIPMHRTGSFAFYCSDQALLNFRLNTQY
jgi:hypothetical protein